MIAVSSFWILAILSIFSMVCSADVRNELAVGGHKILKQKSYYLARSGVTLATSVIDQDPSTEIDHLFEPWANGRELFEEVHMREGWFSVRYSDPAMSSFEDTYAYGIEDEDSKINVNLVPRSVLAALPGIDEDLADCIIDWRDADDKTGPGGAEADYYDSAKLPFTAANRSFVCLEELLMVNGMTAELLESLKPFITVYGDSAVNALTARPEVLTAIGLPEELISKIIDFRTDEAHVARLLEKEELSVSDFVKLVEREESLSHGEIVVLGSAFSGGLLKLSSSVFRIRSEGFVPRSGIDAELQSVSTTIETVYAKIPAGGDEMAPRGFLFWRED